MSTKKQIGRIPISKGKYVAGQTYNRLSQVTLYGSTYQSRVDGNTSAPALLDENGNVQHANTDLWLVIADGREAYNAGEKLSRFSLQESEEYLALETDSDGKILAATNADGSHYAYKMKSETIDAKQDKEEGKGLIDNNVAEAMSIIDDEEDRLQMTKDAEGKIISFRDSDGTLHEHKIAPTHISLSDEAANEVNEAFKSAGIKMENPSDFSKYIHIELPIPRIAAQVRIYAPKLPTTKTDDIEAEIEYNDKDGNYFRKPIIINAQGSSSMSYYVKNMAIDLNDGSEIKFGDFPTQDSFHLKKYYIDIFRGQCIVGYHLMEQVYKSRPIGEQYPYEYSIRNNSCTNGSGSSSKDFFTGAKCHPDGFPINITWINSATNEEQDMGIYAWNLKKHRDVYFCDKKKAENIILDGQIGRSELFYGNINWTAFEIRNPKGLISIDGKEYDGEHPKELSDTDVFSKKVKDYIIHLSGINNAQQESNTKETFENYFLVNPFIDYYLVSQVLWNRDGFWKNWIWCTWDGQHWTPTLYDVDSIFGANFDGTFIATTSMTNTITSYCSNLESLYKEEIKERYKQLRKLGVFSVDNIIGLLNNWLEQVGYYNIKKEIGLYPETPSYRNPNINENWEFAYGGWDARPSVDEWNANKEYSINDMVRYKEYTFKAKVSNVGNPPLDKSYQNYPNNMGFYNSVNRVANWLSEHIKYLDTIFEYINN